MALGAGTLSQRAGGSRGDGVSLRLQLTLVIALLALLPSVVLILATLLPAYRRAGSMTSGDTLTIVLWLVGFVIIATITGYFTSGQLLAPLLRVTKEVDQLSKDANRVAAGRLATPPGEPKEVKALSEAFNDLLEQVEGEQARRTAFSAALMHDLKTPLVAIANLLALVRDDDAMSREERIEVVSKTTTELQALVELVQKLVDAHRLERPEIPLSRERLDLRELVDQLVGRLDTLAEERGVEVAVSGNATAMADRRELERALYNLVSNAVRYAEKSIAIEVFPGLVRISDDGPGLGAPLTELAQPFNDQGVNIAGRRYAAGAGGLGLFIARRVLEAHGGRLVSEASGPKGTVLLAYLGPG